MELLGDRNWWLPRWLDRLVPDIDVEGTIVDGEAEEAEAEASDPVLSGSGAP
jgi:RND superfamily putative drug exporter